MATRMRSWPGWEQRSVAACNFVHVAASVVVKTIKRTKRPYVELQGKRAALLAAKDNVNVFLYVGGLVT